MSFSTSLLDNIPPLVDRRLVIRVFDVEHGACTIIGAVHDTGVAMVDCGHNSTTGWRPSTYIKTVLKRSHLDHLYITNADQDHLSDLDGLRSSGITVGCFTRGSIPHSDLHALKLVGGSLTDDMRHYLHLHQTYNGPVPKAFHQNMGGASVTAFCNAFPAFRDTNNLSMAVFVKRGTFKMLFPGDLESDGWDALLRRQDFQQELAGTRVLMASHHGRLSGFSANLFKHIKPSAIVISDKSIAHTTQEVDYRTVVQDGGVHVRSQMRTRHVLTTRRDGDILFTVQPDGGFDIDTFPT
jgi:beta-lactamase superfamily II metal-dependent hydrolase